MIRTAPARAWASSSGSLLIAVLAGACTLELGSDTDDGGGGGVPRCAECVGEDGGTSAPPGIDGRTVAVLETSAPDPSVDEFIVRGTFPVPPRSVPRVDGRDPYVVLDWDGMPVPTQTEIVTRYANPSDGADVVEVLAKVRRDPASAVGSQVQFEVVQSPSVALPGPGTVGLEDLLATANVPANIQTILADPNAIEIRTYDCFGNKYVARPLDGNGICRLMRRGRVSTEICIYQVLVPEPFVSGPTGTLPHSLGVHVYLSTMTGQEVLGLGLRFNNGSSGRNTQSALDDPLDKLYFREIEVALPADLGFMADFADPYFGGFVGAGNRWVWDLVEPMSNGKMHVIRWLGQFHRRMWIATPSAFPVARSYADGIGQAFCVRGTDPIFGAQYWSWWNQGTARYFPQKYQLPSLDHVGPANMRVALGSERNHLAACLQNGTSDGNYPVAVGTLGWGHPYGVSYGGMTGGNEIFCWDGITTACSASTQGLQMFRALHRMHTDRQPNALYDLDGEPTSVERWLTENGSRDFVPFYHYIVPFLGGSYPEPFGLGNAPRFQINHVTANALQPGYEGAHLSFDPHDYQHFIRYTRAAKVLAWLGNDSIAKDDLWLQAEMYNLSYHEHCNDVHGGFFTGGLRSHRAAVAVNPHKGGNFGRGEAWGLDCAVAAYCFSKPNWRDRKRPWFDKQIELLLDQQGTCNGFLQAIVHDKAVGGKYRARQQIEQSITENALQGLRESVYRNFDPAHAEMTRHVLVESLYAFLSPMAWETDAGPWRYTGVGPLAITAPIWCSSGQMPGDAVTVGDHEIYQDWSSFAYGYELTGDPIFLDYALEQLHPSTEILVRMRNEGTSNIENRSPLLALVQRLNGML